ncbi:hypothetical protein WJX79_004606 [Trebouxia sp. C0005]
MLDSISELVSRSGDSLNLSELPERVAQVQSELQSLEEAVRQTKERVRQVETTREAAFARQQVLQQKLEQDLREVHVLQAQQEDLMALKAAQEQKSRSPDTHTLFQVQRKAARQQLKHTVQETATLLEHCKEGIQRQRVALAGQEDLCHYEDGQFQKLKQAQAQMVASSEVTQANKSIDSVCTKMQECRARIAAQQQEAERLQREHISIKQHNRVLELDFARLQTALQALTAAADMDAQPNLASSVLRHSDTGVFSSHTASPHSITQHPSVAADAACTNPLPFRQKANSLRNTTEQQHAQTQQHLFLYPEDTPLASEQDTERHVLHSRPHTQGNCIQRQPRLQANGAAGREQTQAYTVQEPDSPVQPFQTAHTSSKIPAQNDVQPSRRPSSTPEHAPTGCLYQDTTIRRTTTPSRNGRAWTHHEEVTVRQIREISHSEARAAQVPPPNRPEVMQASEVKEYHRNMEASQATGKVQLKQPQIPSQHIILGKLSSVRGRSRGRGRLTAAQARPAVRQRHTVRPRMKRLFQEDALV